MVACRGQSGGGWLRLNCSLKARCMLGAEPPDFNPAGVIIYSSGYLAQLRLTSRPRLVCADSGGGGRPSEGDLRDLYSVESSFRLQNVERVQGAETRSHRHFEQPRWKNDKRRERPASGGVFTAALIKLWTPRRARRGPLC